jgi:hypothetical protein
MYYWLAFVFSWKSFQSDDWIFEKLSFFLKEKKLDKSFCPILKIDFLKGEKKCEKKSFQI